MQTATALAVTGRRVARHRRRQVVGRVLGQLRVGKTLKLRYRCLSAESARALHLGSSLFAHAPQGRSTACAGMHSVPRQDAWQIGLGQVRQTHICSFLDRGLPSWVSDAAGHARENRRQ